MRGLDGCRIEGRHVGGGCWGFFGELVRRVVAWGVAPWRCVGGR